MIDSTHPQLSVTKQCNLMSVSRSSYYYRPRAKNPDDLILMRQIDELYIEHPSSGSRSICRQLKRQGTIVNRKRVQRLMRLMGIEAVYPKPKTSRPHPKHKVYPYLLRGLRIDRANQVWAADITFIPMPRGFMYLVAIMDWHSRKILSWRVSNTLESDFCIQALCDALNTYGSPEIFNTDQGAQFTSNSFTQVLMDHDVKISMDGRGRCQDNIFIERLWWTLKHQYLYLRSIETGRQLRRGLKSWVRFYNQDRAHSSLLDLTPDEVFFGKPHPHALAA